MRLSHAIFTVGLQLIFVALATGVLIPNSTLNQTNKAGTASAIISSTAPSVTVSMPVGNEPRPPNAISSSSPTHQISLFPRRQASSGIGAAATTSNLMYHGGATMHTSVTFAIFWQPRGASYEPGGNDTSYEKLTTRFLGDLASSSYYNILNQYPDHSNGTPLDKSTFGGSYLDNTTRYPSSGTQSNPLHDSDIQAEVTRAIGATGWVPNSTTLFFVFTGYGIESCSDNLNRYCTFSTPYSYGYCAYHSHFLQGSQNITFANMPDFGGPSGRCNYPFPNDTFAPNRDQYADPEINLVSHELFESVNDPYGDGWYGVGGLSDEIGDKCAWNFGSSNSVSQPNLVLDNHNYLVQEEWSNHNHACALSYGPSNSVSVNLISSLATIPLSSSNSFNITYYANGSKGWTTTAYTNQNVTIFVDANTNVTISGRSLASNQHEEWCLEHSCSDVSFNPGPGAIQRYYYYDLLGQQVSISTNDGGTLIVQTNYTSAPQNPSATDAPELATVLLTNSSQRIFALRATNFTTPFSIYSGLGERWTTSFTELSISQALQISNPIAYYHQYLTAFGFKVVSGGTIGSPPIVTYYQLALSRTGTASFSDWADSGTTYSYQSQLSGSTSSERWSTPSATGTVPAFGTIFTVYYHQYLLTADYSVSYGGSPSAPMLTGTALGSKVGNNLLTQPFQVWLDAGSSFSITNPLGGSTLTERWLASQVSGTINNSASLSFSYYHQYFLIVEGGSGGSDGEGWYDSGQVANASSQGTYSREAGTGLRVASYSVDGVTSPQVIATKEPVIVTKIMDSFHDVQFNSTTQFQLSLDPATLSVLSQITPPTINGDYYWYDSGTTLSTNVPYVWNTVTSGSSRQNLLGYVIDGSIVMIARRDSGTLALPSIKMNTKHQLSISSTLQYYISANGGTLSGSQTNDNWYDSQSDFTFLGEYAKTYSADSPYHAYTLDPGLQILSNTTLSSIAWDNNTLGFTANNADIVLYMPEALNLVPARVLDNGTPLAFTYSEMSRLMSFRGSSNFQINFVKPGNGSSTQPTSDWETYLLNPIVMGVVALLVGGAGTLLYVRRRAARTEARDKHS